MTQEIDFAHLPSTDKVREYILREFIREDIAAGTRLPPVRKISTLLSVSSTTVDLVYKQLVKEGKIETKVGKGTFVAGYLPTAETKRLCIGLNQVFPSGAAKSTSGWGLLLNQAIIEAAFRHQGQIVFQPLTTPISSPQGHPLLKAEMKTVDGLIFVPPPPNSSESRIIDQFLQSCEDEGKPVVTIHPRNLLCTANFVSADFLHSARLLARALIESGRRHLWCIGLKSLHSTPTNALRLLGLQLGISEAGKSPLEHLHSLEAPGISESDGFTITLDQLKTGPAPDAVYCFGDYVALGVKAALESKGIKVPEDTSVIGGTGLPFHSGPAAQLTRLKQPFDQLGNQSLEMLIERISSPGKHLPGRYIDAPFFVGSTTRLVENELLARAAVG